jgi:hypothetical protein
LFILAVLVILAGMGLSRTLLLQQAAPEQRQAEWLDQDFRGSRKPREPLERFGPDAERVSKPEDEGWRITLAADRPLLTPVGLVSTAHLRGNFTLTAGYEILQADQPTTGDGVGLELYVMLDSPTRDAFGLYRMARVKEGDVFWCVRMTTRDGKRLSRGEPRPALRKAGQMQVSRQGTEVKFQAKEEGEADFRELAKYDLSSADVTSIRLAAFTGSAKYAVDLRIRDLKISVEDRVANPIADPPSVPTTRNRGWLLAGGMIALLIVFTSVAVWLLVRRSRRKELQTAAISELSPEADDTTAPLLCLTCAGCRSPVKVRAELAGNKIKCPHCGQAVPVP